MSKNASQKELGSLHGRLASLFKEILENGEVVVDKQTGEAVKVTPGASTLNTIRQFLKDNGISSVKEHDPAMEQLAQALPFHSNNDEHGLPQ